jgi:5-amino-6-(5-phospho-D-ribitylamino)uracil phosphatase
MKKLLIAVDVDGTLIDTEFEDAIRPEVADAIKRVRNAGHIVALCTGRNSRSADHVVKSADGALDGVPMILLNGAVVYGGSLAGMLRHACLNKDLQRTVVELFHKHNVKPMLFGGDDEGGWLVHGKMEANDILQQYLDKRRDMIGQMNEVQDLLAELPETVLGIGSIDVKKQINPLKLELNDTLGDKVHLVKTQAMMDKESYLWLEVYPQDCGKGSGLRLLADKLGFSYDSIVAIGDNYNDLDMFDAAGHTVSMGNAPAEVQKVTDRVAPSVQQNGAAIILDEITNGEYPIWSDNDTK